MFKRTRTEILLWLCSLAAFAGGAVYLYFMDPHKPGKFPGCPFLTLTGFYCPGCGSLRAMHCLMHGHPGEAAARNILALVLLPITAYAAAIDFTRGQPIPLGRRSIQLPALPIRTPIIIFVLVITYWIARNLPWYPFTLLAPRV